MDIKKSIYALSLISRGARSQFAVAIVLMSLIPLCLVVFLVSEAHPETGPAFVMLNGLAFLAIVLAFLGWRILVKYPLNILRLRKYLEDLAREEIPHPIEIEKGESDLAAIEQNMRHIVRQTEERIQTIEKQMRLLLASERQRVVIESLGAACHHLGQPTTVLVTSLQIMKNQESLPAQTRELITLCAEAAQELTVILDKLRLISEYKTEPYLETGSDHVPSKDRILTV